MFDSGTSTVFYKNTVVNYAEEMEAQRYDMI
jgi:hypothetical protein